MAFLYLLVLLKTVGNTWIFRVEDIRKTYFIYRNKNPGIITEKKTELYWYLRKIRPPYPVSTSFIV